MTSSSLQSDSTGNIKTEKVDEQHATECDEYQVETQIPEASSDDPKQMKPLTWSPMKSDSDIKTEQADEQNSTEDDEEGVEEDDVEEEEEIEDDDKEEDKEEEQDKKENPHAFRKWLLKCFFWSRVFSFILFLPSLITLITEREEPDQDLSVVGNVTNARCEGLEGNLSCESYITEENKSEALVSEIVLQENESEAVLQDKELLVDPDFDSSPVSENASKDEKPSWVTWLIQGRGIEKIRQAENEKNGKPRSKWWLLGGVIPVAVGAKVLWAKTLFF